MGRLERSLFCFCVGLKRAYFSVLFLYFFDTSLVWQFKMRGFVFYSMGDSLKARFIFLCLCCVGDGLRERALFFRFVLCGTSFYSTALW